MRTALLAFAVILALMWPTPALAQSAQRSSIEGLVTDQQGAVVVGATVTLSGDRLLGGTRTTATDHAGRYRFGGLLPGTYDAVATAAALEGGSRAGIQLPVETTYTVNFTLVVASVAASVEVAAHVPLIDVRSAATPTLFGEQMLYDLPTQRTLQSVLSLTPGVTTTTPLFGYVGEVAFGGTQGSNGFSVDGVNLTESSLGDQWSQVNYNWLEQVQVVGLGAAAEYGTSTGAIVNGVLRSGSNRVNGMAEWLTIRPSWSGNNLGNYPADQEKPLAPKTILSWWDLNGQAGAPLVRDRLWLFGGANHLRHQYRGYGFDGPGSTDERTGRLIAKVDAALTSRLMLQAFITRDASDVFGERLSPYNPTPESSPDVFTRTRAWNARATWTASGNTVAEVRTSGFSGTVTYEPHEPGTREGPASSQDLVTGIQCCNAFWRDEFRSSVTAAVTIGHHHEGPLGRHDFRAGVEFERAPFETAIGRPTGRSLYTQDGKVVMYEDWAGDHSAATARRAVIYAQDRWVLHNRVTLEPGVRFEHNRGSVPGVPNDFGTDAVALRLGAAWDITGTQSTVVRGHYGRYHDPLYGGVYTYTQPNAHSPHIFYQIVDGQPQELFRYVEEVNLPGPSSLKASHVDQWVAGVERAVGPNTTVQAQYIGRRFGNFIAWVDRRLTDWIPYQVRDPGIDGVPGTADDGGLVTVYQSYYNGPDISGRALELGNPEGAYRRYDAIQLIGTRRFANNWQYQISYTWSRSTGTIGNQYHTNALYSSTNPGGYGANPAARLAPPAPPLYDYSEFKALGSYRAPWFGGFTVGGVFRWHSGTHWQRDARVTTPIFAGFPAEPIGSRRTPSLGGLDLRVEKTIRIQGGSLGLYVDAFNVTNLGRATGYTALSGPNFGDVWGWTDPRTMRLGVRYSF